MRTRILSPLVRVFRRIDKSQKTASFSPASGLTVFKSCSWASISFGFFEILAWINDVPTTHQSLRELSYPAETS